MDFAGMRIVVQELKKALSAEIAHARSQPTTSAADFPSGTVGWFPYVPLSDDTTPPIILPSQWRRIELVSVDAAAQLLIVTFRWEPTSQLFAHATDMSAWSGPEHAAVRIRDAIIRAVGSDNFPALPKSLVVRSVTIIAGG